MKNLITPTKKAARASAGTPDVARGLATRHTKNSMRSANLDITPVKTSPVKRKSPTKLKGSPSKMAKSDRIKMKRKAVATLTSMDKRSRKKSLFTNDQSDSTSHKKVKFSSDVAAVATDVCLCSLLDCSACNLTNLDVVKVEKTGSGCGDISLASVMTPSNHNLDKSSEKVIVGNEMTLSAGTADTIFPNFTDDVCNNNSITTSESAILSNTKIRGGNKSSKSTQEIIDNSLCLSKHVKEENTEVCPSKPLHVKCKDFPIRASTCIVPKPSPPFSLIKAMRQLQNVDFSSPATRACHHSICYHNNNCCHSDNSGSNDKDGAISVVEESNNNVPSDNSHRCNNNLVQVTEGHVAVKMGEDHNDDSRSVCKTLFPIPECRMSVSM